MKTILCYGDSLTWGYDAENGGRHALTDRWPTVLGEGLGDGVNVIAEGLNGRTTAYDDYLADCDRNGARLLPTVLHSHAPIGLVIFMLGTNDMKPLIAGTAYSAYHGIERLVELTRQHAWPLPMKAPRMLIVAPPVLSPTQNAAFTAMFAGGIAESAKLAELYGELAREAGCGFFDASTVATTTPIDGVHLDAENTRAIGRALQPVVRSMLGL